ncbi:MAG: tyrosine-type recombinase/integrase, partial [Planctomycetia bacterium]|nr:tyrosine-type recombinase/integrase [Planctomycetia bacterium]
MATTNRKFTDDWFATVHAPAGVAQVTFRDSAKGSRLCLLVGRHTKTFFTSAMVNGVRKNFLPIHATTVDEARDKCENLHRGFRDQRKTKVTTLPGHLPLLKHRVQAYLTDHKRPLTTATQLQRGIETHFAEYLDRPVDALTPEVVDDLRRRLKIPKRVLVTLRAVLRFYMRKGKMADPLADVPDDALAQEEKVELIDALKAHPGRLQDIIKHGYGYGNPALGLLNELTLFTGLRPRELIKLRWDDINLDKADGPEWFIALSGKGKKPREKRIHLPMSDHVARLLIDRKQLRRDQHPFVFPHHEKAKQEHMDKGGYKKMIAHIRKKCGAGFNG